MPAAPIFLQKLARSATVVRCFHYGPASPGNECCSSAVNLFQNLSLALRTFPKASASESPSFTPTFFRISSLISHRRKGFVFFSSPIMEGTVGSPRDRLSLILLNRATKSGLLGLNNRTDEKQTDLAGHIHTTR